MRIDYEAMPETVNEHFKGGLGRMIGKTFADDHVRVIRGRLTPGSTIGLHVHEGTCEVVYILSGTGRMLCDGVYEPMEAGVCHYCPPGHEHSLINDSREDLCFLGIVPDLRSLS